VVEITESQAAIIACLDTAEVLDRIPECGGAFRARVAREELLFVGGSAAAADLLAFATAYLERAGSSGLAVDVTDAWSVCTVSGADAAEVWARLSENRLPDERPAFVQGAVASIPAKTIAGDGEIHVLTPSNLGHHVPHRIFGLCRDLAPQAGAPRQFAVRRAAGGAAASTAAAAPAAPSTDTTRARVAS
jgi:hypothetical protein